MKVGNLVRWEALNGNLLIGIIIGFDKENDPIVKSCNSGITIAHWRDSLEILG